jgi:ATP-binding cassette subfamily F protein 3
LPGKAAAEPEPVVSLADRKEQKRLEAEQRQKISALKKPIEQRIKRLDEQIAKLNARKAEIDARLAHPDIYDAANKEELKTLITDQAYCIKELDQMENEWLEQQDALEQLQA